MHISYFHFLIFLSAILLSTTDAQRVITSPGTCLRDSDCDEFSEYCTSNYECRKRGKKNSECFRNVECSHGLYCGEVNDRRVCVAQNALFEKCDHSFENPCAVDGRFTYKCSPVSNTCEYTGFDGSTCFGISDCQIGSYCKDAGNINGGKCSPKLRDGERCDLTGDSWECEGFCATGNFDDFEGGVCVFGSTFGEPCTQNDHCNGYATAVNDPNSLGVSSIICNVAKGNTGVCEHERDLIKKEGIKCNPAKDTCDYERGLSCRSTPTGPKCMFNKFDSDVGGPRFCDINGNLSKCNLLQGTPSECRRDFDDSSPFGNQYKEFFKCQRKTETIPHGLPCNNVGFSVCEQGTTCMFVPGVLQRSRKFSRQTKFCVKVKKEGEKCYSKFKFACENGLKCENNVCVKGKPDETITHGFETISCESQSCAPGLECVESFGFKSCQFKKIEKSKGACFQTALTGTDCIGGTVCERNDKGLGLLACRKKKRAGAICTYDDACESPLQCSIKCYNPKLNIPLGQKCNPNAKPWQRTCSVANDGYSPTACLPKYKGFACQKVAELYERCDARKNVACSKSSNSVCSKDGVCVPRK